MLVAPARRSSPIARLRSAAMACAPAPLRTWERSSSKVTSRTQCSRFSIAQCPLRANDGETTRTPVITVEGEEVSPDVIAEEK